MNKKTLGQFYTTNYKYILQNMYIPDDVKNIIEPFAGNGDLLNFIKDKNKYNITCYDIDPKKSFIIKQDTLLNPPNFDNAFILTNPPYLARNKSIDKFIFNKYTTNDLYKCFIQLLINSNCLGGILIIPLNFLCSVRKNDINIRVDIVCKNYRYIKIRRIINKL
jgi:tRNA1(Val) A37 N6-methylase TrmN6